MFLFKKRRLAPDTSYDEGFYDAIRTLQIARYSGKLVGELWRVGKALDNYERFMHEKSDI